MPDFFCHEIIKTLRTCGAPVVCSCCPTGGDYPFNDRTLDICPKAADIIETVQESQKLLLLNTNN